jgi:peptide/nickel transport system substrate-binding protein
MKDSLRPDSKAERTSVVVSDQDGSSSNATANLTRRTLISRAGAAGAVMSLSGLLAACGSSEDTSGSASTTAAQAASGAEVDHIAVGYGGAAPTGLDIANAWEISQMTAANLGMEGLVVSDDRLRWRPGLAKSWTQPDPLHYIFELRPGVKFWDGSLVTVDDVVFSLERLAGPSSLITSYYTTVKSIKATGSHEVTITLTKPDPTLPGVLVFSPITSKAFFERLGKKFGAPGSPVTVLGTGPYKITAYSIESGVEVERNPHYWGDKPKVKAATIKFFEDPQTTRLAAQGGEIDAVIQFPLSLAKDWEGTSGFTTQYPPGLNIGMLTMNVEKAPWNDIHVRRAVAYCADSAGYIKAFLSGKAMAATAMVPPAQWADVATEGEVSTLYQSLKQYPYDINAAKEELAKSAYPNGFTEEVEFPANNPVIGSTLESLGQALGEIGITLKVKQVSQNAYGTKFFENNLPGLSLGEAFPDYADPSDYLQVFLPSANAVPGSYNGAHFKNKEVDKLLDEQAAATDNTKRREILGEVLKVVADELPYLTLWWGTTPGATKDQYVNDGFNALFFYQPWLTNVGAAA